MNRIQAPLIDGYNSGADLFMEDWVIAPELLGAVVFSRILDLSTNKYDQYVRRLDTSAALTHLCTPMGIGQLPDARVAVSDGNPLCPSKLLGEIRIVEGKPVIFYCRSSYARQYLIDEKHMQQKSGADPASRRILVKMRLVNSRNLLTDAILNELLCLQQAYLLTNRRLLLHPISQAELARRLRFNAGLYMIPDPSRISRLARSIRIKLPCGEIVSLKRLLPKPRLVYGYYVNHAIKREKEWMLRGALDKPMTDEDISAFIGRKFLSEVSRRTVANIRKDMGIPDSHDRSHQHPYLAAAGGFSPLIDLTREGLHSVPSLPGVYEIRSNEDIASRETSSFTMKSVGPKIQPIIYIGSSNDMNKRIKEHLRGFSNNLILQQLVSDGTARVRFQIIQQDWRSTERKLYQTYLDTFGESPLCNRISP